MRGFGKGRKRGTQAGRSHCGSGRPLRIEQCEERVLLSVAPTSRDLLIAYLQAHQPEIEASSMNSSHLCGPIQNTSTITDGIVIPADGADSSQFDPYSGIRYVNGDGIVTANDLGTGVSRVYSSQTTWAQDQGLGAGWHSPTCPMSAVTTA